MHIISIHEYTPVARLHNFLYYIRYDYSIRVPSVGQINDTSDTTGRVETLQRKSARSVNDENKKRKKKNNRALSRQFFFLPHNLYSLNALYSPSIFINLFIYFV